MGVVQVVGYDGLDEALGHEITEESLGLADKF